MLPTDVVLFASTPEEKFDVEQSRKIKKFGLNRGTPPSVSIR